MSTDGLVVIAGGLVGAGLGGSAGMITALLWASMEPGAMDAIAWPLYGIFAGAIIGAGVAAWIVG